MAKRPLTDRSTEELEKMLRATGTIRLTVAIIFGIIIAVWIVGGYWSKNVPVFISTIAMGVAVTAAQFASVSGIRQELERRRNTAVTGK